MKKIRFIITALVAALTLGLTACGTVNVSFDGGVGELGGYAGLAERLDGKGYDAAVGGGNGSSGGAGAMTAAAWNDNENYSFFTSLFFKGQGEEDSGKFAGFTVDEWGLYKKERVKVRVTDGETAMRGAKVTLKNADGDALFVAKTDSAGCAYLFTDETSGKITAEYGGETVEKTFGEDEREIAIDLQGGEITNVIKLMFVIDVTGSMGDELTYLQTEIKDVIHRVAESDASTRIDLALLFYRDDGDDEKFAYHDFLNVKDEQNLDLQAQRLAGQSAQGGGDYPEAVDEALELAVGKEWGDDDSTKLIFHVLDAPPHDKAENKTRFNAAVNAAAAKGIRICPLICSGTDVLTEYLERQAAIYTGGTFCFVTDHSGIGGAHHDPQIPNAVVEKLNDLLVRLITGYHAGEFAAPVPYNAQSGAQTSESE